MLHHLIYVFSIFQAIYEYHTTKNLPLLPPTIHQAIFFIYRYEVNRCSAIHDPLMQTSGNRKEPILMSKPYGVELPSWMFPMCRKPVLLYVMNIVMKKNIIVLPLSVYCPFLSNKWFKLVNCSSISCLPRF